MRLVAYLIKVLESLFTTPEFYWLESCQDKDFLDYEC